MRSGLAMSSHLANVLRKKRIIGQVPPQSRGAIDEPEGQQAPGQRRPTWQAADL
jgi:hypothetical protein